MKRREIIASIGAGLVLPAAARAQQPGRTYRVATLSFTNRRVAPVVVLIEELRALGFVEGRNLVIDPRGSRRHRADPAAAAPRRGGGVAATPCRRPGSRHQS